MGKDIIMAKGSESKTIFYEKILETFKGSFMYNGGKEIRIPFTEDGKDIQLKIVATCAKDNVEPGGDEAIPGAAPVKATKVTIAEGAEPVFEDASETVAPSQDELNAVSNLMEALGL